MYRQHYPDHPGMHNSGSSFDSSRVLYHQNPSFLERLKSGFVAFFIGLLLILIAVYILFWNEGRAVQTASSLDEGFRHLLPLKTTEVAFQENNGKLVYLSGPLKITQPLEDSLYNIRLQCARLKRTVEMYQWVEEERKTEYNENGQTRTETTYSYSKEWRSDLIRSSSFNSPGYQNPDTFPETSTEFFAETKIGSFILSKNLIKKITNFKLYKPKDLPADPLIRIFGSSFYHSENPLNPNIGDARVTFHYSGAALSSRGEKSLLGNPDHASVIAKQMGQYLHPYQTESGDELEILYQYDLTPQEMFLKEHNANTVLTWCLRLGGCFLMFIGFGCLTTLLTTLVDTIPIIRELFTLGVNLMNLSLTLSLSLTVIALGWIRYRPLLGLTLLACASAPFILSHRRVRIFGTSQRI